MAGLVAVLGPPVYRACGRTPGASFGADGDPPTSISLSFGPPAKRLMVETSVSVIDDRRILLELIAFHDPSYPLTVSEENSLVVVDGEPTDFRLLRLKEDFWSSVATVGDRCVYLRGIGIASTEIAIEPTD